MDYKSLSLEELTNRLTALGYPGYRAVQVYGWIHQKQAADFSEMTNLPAKLRDELEAAGELVTLEPVKSITSKDGETTKYLFRLPDGHVIESVLMHYRHGNSVCISSQVGCKMGCRFCASTLGGKVRDLYPSEFLDQIYRIQRLSGSRVSHVVVMGTGEPLDNYDNLIRFLHLISDEKGLNISQRNITLSTCGLPAQIRSLAEERLQITLAISLHAADDEARRRIMPVAERYSIAEILSACDYYFSQTGRRISFEYSLIEGENDSLDSAKQLAALLSGRNCHVNLIPVNPIRERSYRHSSMGQITKFKKVLEDNRINVTVRREMGADIDAACGQLRKDYMDAPT